MNAITMIEIDAAALAIEREEQNMESRLRETKLVAAEIDAIFAGAEGIWATTETQGTHVHLKADEVTATFAARMHLGRLEVKSYGQWIEISRPGDIAKPLADVLRDSREL